METTFHVQISLPCEMSDWKSEASQTPSVECDRKNRRPVGASVRTKTSSVFDVSWHCQDPWHSETLRTVLETPAALGFLVWIRPREERKHFHAKLILIFPFRLFLWLFICASLSFLKGSVFESWEDSVSLLQGEFHWSDSWGKPAPLTTFDQNMVREWNRKFLRDMST